MKASAVPAIELSKRFGASPRAVLAISHRLAIPAVAVQVLKD